MLLHNTHFEYDPFYNFVNDFFFFLLHADEQRVFDWWFEIQTGVVF